MCKEAHEKAEGHWTEHMVSRIHSTQKCNEE